MLTQLEKNAGDKSLINALFRITHTLKGNASGMGFTAIAELGHALEDLFGEVREGTLVMTPEIFSAVYKGADILGNLINAVQDNRTVKHRGIKTRLEVIVQQAKRVAEDEAIAHNTTATSSQTVETLTDTTEDISDDPDENKVAFSDLVQVPVRKLDNLLNLVGELIIEKDRILAQAGGRHGSNEFARLSRISSDLQYSVMDVRMVQVGFLFNKFHRVVRDAAVMEKKQVRLKLEGSDTEIDRNVLQVISDSLIHLIRNAVGHGVETPEDRERLGKPEEGTITLRAKGDTDVVIVEIQDDGKGLDHEKIRKRAIEKGLITEEAAARMPVEELSLLIFEPGFSTAEQIPVFPGGA